MAKANKKQATKRQTAASFRLAERSRSFRDFIATNDESFKELAEIDQNPIASLLYKAHVGGFSHNSEEPGEFPIHWKAKQEKFGTAAHFDYLNARLGWFQKVKGAKVGESAEAWTMTQRARKLLDAFHDKGRQQHLPFYDTPDNERGFVDQENRTCRKPQSPIASKASNSTNTNFKPWSLPLNVTVDGNNLHAFLYAATARLHGDDCPNGFEWAWKAWDDVEATKGLDKLHMRLSETIGQAGEFLRNAWVSKLKGFVVHQCYHETDSGRLVADGILNLQSCHREVRKAALPGHYDYDVECCHYALLANLAHRQGFDTPHIDAYINDKRKLRREVQLTIGKPHTYTTAKKILTALIYGAPLSSSLQASIAATVGREAATRLCMLKPLVDLHAELKAARSVVYESYRGEVERTGKITNAAGRRIVAKGVKANKLLSHILIGEESQVLKVAIAYASEHIVLLAHDGFVTVDPINAAELESRIRKHTGHKLSLAAEQFAPAGRIPA
tara:strand:- start:621 stop:2126 length:1506 start_codon:yes stop_codon:yes gene_type:complete